MTKDDTTTTGLISVGASPIVVHMTRKSNQWPNKFNCGGNLCRIVAIFLIQGVVPFATMINGELYVSALYLHKMIIRKTIHVFLWPFHQIWHVISNIKRSSNKWNEELLPAMLIWEKKNPNLELEMKSCNGFLVLWKHILMSWSLWGFIAIWGLPLLRWAFSGML